MKRIPSRAPIFAALIPLALLSSSALGAIVHNFSGGSGVNNSTQYAGTAGNGWSSAFAAGSENTAATATVTNANPLSTGGGNYVQRKVTGTAKEGSNIYRNSVHRKYESYGDLNVSTAHTISFEWRADEIGEEFNSKSDYFMMFGGRAGSDSDATATWMIRLQGANEGGLRAGKFAIYNGNSGINSNYNENNWINTDVVASVGIAYRFTIVNDPVAALWSISIEEVGGPVLYQREDLGWRSAARDDANTLAWGARVSDVGESLTYSIDNIAIIPEPAISLLGVSGALFMLRRKRR